MATYRQPAAFPPGKYRGQVFDKERLKRHIDGTNKALAAGVPIPILKKHATLDADDRATLAFANDHGQGAGWLKGLFQDDDGALGWEADLPDEVIKDIESGVLKYTSPEFRNNYKCEKDGVYEGPIVRHIAFTPFPGNPHQGEMSPVEASQVLALEENLLTGSFQFSEVEREPLEGEESTDEGSEQFGEHHVYHQLYAGDAAEFHNAVERHGGKVVGGPGGNHSTFKSKTAVNKFKKEAQGRGWHDGKHYTVTTEPEVQIPSQHAEEERQPLEENESQHSEFFESRLSHTHEDVVRKHGWNLQSDSGGTKTYAHPNLPGHALHLDRTGWTHEVGGKESRGSDKRSLHDHLTKVHSSQHAEEQQAGKPPGQPPEFKAEMTNKDNPDMPPAATDKSKLKAVVAGLNRLNIVLPSDFDFTQDGSIDIMLAAINSSLAAKNAAEAESQADDSTDEDQVREAAMPFSEEELSEQFGEKEYHDVLKQHGFQMVKRGIAGGGHTYKKGKTTIHVARVNGQTKGWSRHSPDLYTHGDSHQDLATHLGGSQHSEVDPLQFSEEELQALPEKVRNVVAAGQKALAAEKEARVKAEQEALQFAEQERQTRNNAARDENIRKVLGTKIPPVLKQTLLQRYRAEDNAIQFTEGSEQPTFTAAEVAEMVAKAIPPALIFEEDDPVETETPTAAEVIGHDEKGNPVLGPSTQAAYFSRNGNKVQRHITADRANELLATSPVKGAYQSVTPMGHTPANEFLEKTIQADNAAHPIPDFAAVFGQQASP